MKRILPLLPFPRLSWAGALASAVVLSAVAVTAVGCSSKKDAAKSETSGCTNQALTKGPLTGASMKLKTLSFTFDDGPGGRTIELSRYLKAEGIRATFFIMGTALETDGAGANTLQNLIDDGHLIANHTEHHYSLTEHVPTPLTPEEQVAELTDVDKQIAPFVKDNIWLFRPPYGHWNDTVQDTLDKSEMKKYVGPILWNVGGSMTANAASDVECWKAGSGITVTACGDLYMKEIDFVGKGIVLMHDPYFIDMHNPESGGTYQMVQYMVPILKSKGYTFIRLDEVPDVAALLPGGKPADPANPADPGATTNPGETTTEPSPCP